MDHNPAPGPARAHRVGTAVAAAPLPPAPVAGAVLEHARRCGRLVLCTDFDGTIAPIVATPATARALPAAVEALDLLTGPGADRGVGLNVPVVAAVITSRSSGDLLRHLALGPSAVVLGSAGLERSHGGTTVVDPRAAPWLDTVAAAADRFAAALAGGAVAGARLERKPCGAVLHTRGVRRAGIDGEALALATEVAADIGLRLVSGKRSVELRPPVDADKGTALRDLVGTATAAVVAAGDDVPDVPMLAVAAAIEGGVAVAVCDAETPAPVLEASTHHLDGPWAWALALREIAAGLRRRRRI